MRGWHLGGIGIAIVLLLFMAIPMATRNANHPLSGETTLDVCAMLQQGAFDRLGETPVKIEARIPGEKAEGKPVCTAELAPAARNGPPRNVWTMVSTMRMLSAGAGGRPVNTDRMVETWLKESKASGAEVDPVKGPWRTAAFITEPNRQSRLTLLIDDRGVMLWINSDGVDRDKVLAFAEAAVPKLRGNK